ncbi:MAG: AAA family ATPase [Fusobacteriaceae bacterium]|nr:AAA family ATPase [Fusobacteriaceae bacterium]MBN2839289.1 AAA family ATPase [Fusobacteriaceae bacterium]
MNKKVGFTLGKFAPFHKGHQYIIEMALKEMDEVVVLIYNTEVINIPLNIRANWIRKIYPTVKVIEGWDGPDGYSNERSFEIMQENYIIEMLNGIKVTHFYSSEFYGDHVSKALEALDIRVDEEREIVPISGTMIRENPYKYRGFLDDIVYQDLITKVVFLGAPSTGKSTISEALAKKYNTTFASEYGRDYWTENQVDRRIGFDDFDKIALGHIEQEDKELKNADKYFFVDTNAITTYMFALDYHGKAPELLEKIAKENIMRYDLFFLCEDDIPYDDTWDRSGEQKRKTFHMAIKADLYERRIPFISLKGTLEERIEKVERILRSFEKYGNYYGKDK